MKLKRSIASFGAVLKSGVFRVNSPLSVTMSITGQCNYRCSYCRVWEKRRDCIPTEHLLNLIESLASSGTQRLGFTQDEPLLHVDLGKILAFCKSLGLFVTLGTNGSLLKKWIHELYNLDILIFSLDGPQAVHDRHRVPGAHSHVVEGIKLARENDIEVWTTTVLTRFNLECIEYILELAEKLHFKAAFQLLYHSPVISGDTRELLPSSFDYRNTIKNIMNAKKQGRPVVNSMSLLKFLYAWPEYGDIFYNPEVKNGKKLRCHGGSLFCHIEPNGDLFPCSQLIGKPLNCLEHGLKPAMDKASQNACRFSCLGADYIEYNLLFSLNPGALWNTRKLI